MSQKIAYEVVLLSINILHKSSKTLSASAKAISSEFPVNIKMKAAASDSVFKTPNFIASFYGVKDMYCFMLDVPLKGITDSLTERADERSSMRFSYGGV